MPEHSEEIVQRLRDAHHFRFTGDPYGMEAPSLYTEAADEIVRLLAEMKRLEALLKEANDAFDEVTGDYAKNWLRARSGGSSAVRRPTVAEDFRLLRRGSTAWCLEFGVEVIDPDGWDRSSLDESWMEPITLDEFVARVMRSTVRTLGSLPYVSEGRNPQAQFQAFERNLDFVSGSKEDDRG